MLDPHDGPRMALGCQLLSHDTFIAEEDSNPRKVSPFCALLSSKCVFTLDANGDQLVNYASRILLPDKTAPTR